MGTKRKKNNKKNIHYLRIVLPITIVLIVIVWFLPIEEKTNLINNPNQKAATTFIGGDYSINTEGGFLYRINDKTHLTDELTFKQNSPVTLIKIKSTASKSVRLNILNSSAEAEVIVNGEPKKLTLYNVNQTLKEQIESNNYPSANVVKSGAYLNDPKGAFVDINLQSGENNIFIASKSSNNSLKFSVASDFHSGYTVGFNGFMQMIKAKPDFIVINGDIVDYGNKAEYIVAGSFTEASPIPIYTVIGNHENWQKGAKFYQNYFGPFTKSFTYKNSLFVFLDDHTGFITESQFDWLDSVLTNSQAEHKFVFAHMPAIDAHWGKFDSGTYKNPQNRHNLYSKEQSDHLIEILNKYKVDAMFSGHDHVYNKIKLGSVTQVNSGALGGKMRAVDTITYINVTVDGPKVQIDNMSVADTNGAYNKEHANKIKFITTFAKPYLSDKKIRISLTAAILVVLISIILFKQYYLKVLCKVKKK